MENENNPAAIMELHKQGYTNKEIAEITGKSLKSIENLLHRARNPRIHEIQGHYKKIFTSLDEDISIRGKYMSVAMKSVLSNITLLQDDMYHNENPTTYNLFEFLYHNIWLARISIASTLGGLCMIDSDGFQHKLADICDYHSYTKWAHSSDIRKVYFPWPAITLESKAKTLGWWWCRPLKDGIVPLRFVLKFDIFKPGDTSGWVQDHETLEFEFARPALISEIIKDSEIKLRKGEIGHPS